MWLCLWGGEKVDSFREERSYCFILKFLFYLSVSLRTCLEWECLVANAAAMHVRFLQFLKWFLCCLQRERVMLACLVAALFLADMFIII